MDEKSARSLDGMGSMLEQVATQIRLIAYKTARALEQQGIGDAETLAPDIYQEITLHVIAQFSKWTPSGEWSHWVARVARRKAIDILRSHRGHQKPVSLDDRTGEFLKNVLVGESHENIESQLMMHEIHKCVDRLPPAHRTIFHMVCELGMTASKCGQALNCPEASVRVWLFRARRSLRECLTKRGISGVRGGGR